jgi:hypothetical protein
LLGLFFYPEDCGEMFLRNVGILPTEYTALEKMILLIENLLKEGTAMAS